MANNCASSQQQISTLRSKNDVFFWSQINIAPGSNKDNFNRSEIDCFKPRKDLSESENNIFMRGNGVFDRSEDNVFEYEDNTPGRVKDDAFKSKNSDVFRSGNNFSRSGDSCL